MLKIKQVGLNLIIKEDDAPSYTVTIKPDFNTDKLFALAYKANEGTKVARTLFEKELSLIKAPVIVPLNEGRIKKKLLEKTVKAIKSLDVSDLPIVMTEDWSALLQDNAHIKNFLIWLALNDNKYTRENFLKLFGSKKAYITPNGFIVSVRQVWKNVEESTDHLYAFVESEYIKVKGWKKSPKNFLVFEKTDDNGAKTYKSLKERTSEIGWKELGNLADLKDTLVKNSEATVTYHSNYNHGSPEKREKWKLGEVAEIHQKGTHRDICGVNQLHIRSNPLDWTNEGYGDTSVVVLVNPKDVINIEAGWKYTTARMYIAAEITKDEITDNFTKDFGKFDFDYLQLDMKELMQLEARKKLTELKQEIQEMKKPLLNNTHEHIEPVLYGEIIKNRLQLVKQ